MAEIAIKILSSVAVFGPLIVLGRSLFQALFPAKIVITNHNGRIVKEITAESAIRDNPAELKRFHKDVQRRIRDAKAA
ncbi:hypothetical protein [Methylobacterium sp. Leaf111]|uniref:hypothetical protein n=1 Tax=Methylobacterium sp. Leaf111 TaxID=1736257 RepID=UPI000A53A82D|nr:hypothetical protein [Methylobacterium sp. Leaf111]